MNWYLIIIINGRFTTDITRLLSGHKYTCANTCMQNFPFTQACVFIFSNLFSKYSSIAFWEDGPHSFPHCTFLALFSVALRRTLSLILFSLLVCFIFACHYSSGRNYSVQNSLLPRCKETQFLHSLLILLEWYTLKWFLYICKVFTGRIADKCTGWQEIVCLYISPPFFYHPQRKTLFLRKNCQRIWIKYRITQNHRTKF